MANKDTHDLLDYIPRFGYFAKGTVYILVGILATMVAVGAGGQTGGSRDAVQFLAQAPASTVILAALAVGLFCYALWRLAQALIDPEDDENGDAKGVVTRARSLGSGVVHVALAVYTGKVAFGSGNSGGSSWSRELMATDIGPFLIGAVGVAIGAMGLYQFYKAYTDNFLDKLATWQMSAQAKDVVERLGEFGHAARGVVFLLIAWFFIDAALSHSSSEAANAGLGEALNTIAAQPYGMIMLGVVALGVAAYGAFCGVKGYYRKLAF